MSESTPSPRTDAVVETVARIICWVAYGLAGLGLALFGLYICVYAGASLGLWDIEAR
jgi:hypothetical protein